MILTELERKIVGVCAGEIHQLPYQSSEYKEASRRLNGIGLIQHTMVDDQPTSTATAAGHAALREWDGRGVVMTPKMENETAPEHAGTSARQEREAWTPGPWFVVGPHPDNNSWTIQTSEYGGGTCIAQKYGDASFSEAHLIAAAPDLYEALEDAKAELEAYEADATGEHYNNPALNAALAKARGQS